MLGTIRFLQKPKEVRLRIVSTSPVYARMEHFVRHWPRQWQQMICTGLKVSASESNGCPPRSGCSENIRLFAYQTINTEFAWATRGYPNRCISLLMVFTPRLQMDWNLGFQKSLSQWRNDKQTILVYSPDRDY